MDRIRAEWCAWEARRDSHASERACRECATLDTGLDVRRAARSGALDAPTSGLAYGYVQGNLAILPHDHAEDFLRFCQANPKPCPLLGVSEAGDPAIPALAADLDIRTDIPRYRVWRDGALVDEPRDIKSVWRDDLVSFVLGCSFSFEEALLAADVPVRHIALDRQRADVSHQCCRPRAPGASTARWSSRCGR